MSGTTLVRFGLTAIVALSLTACDQHSGLPQADVGADMIQAQDLAPPADARPDTGAVDGAPPKVDGGGGVIKIYVKGDLSQKTFNDGLTGQTPTNYQIAISRYDILRSAADPSPVLCFDHGKTPFVVDALKDNLVGQCLTSKISSGAYTHGRTRVDYARYTVNGVYHYLGQKLPGKFTFFRAYSDVVYKQKPYKAGTGFVSFSGLATVSIPMLYGPMPSMPGVKFETKNGVMSMTFAYSKPLPIVTNDSGTHWARFHWMVRESFRWAELSLPNYQKGAWDVSPLLSNTEAVKLHGVSGYMVTSSVD